MFIIVLKVNKVNKKECFTKRKKNFAIVYKILHNNNNRRKCHFNCNQLNESE